MTDPKSKYKEILLNYLPEPAVDTMADWILHFNFNLKITENRASKLGDYRPPIHNSRHSITINHNLNKYAFLITLVHEIAHLTTFEKYQRSEHKRILPHGEEWKQEYKNLMRYYLNEQIFPDDVMKALIQYMHNPAASSCADENLLRVLRKHDTRRKSWVHIEELAIGTTFRYGKNRFFVKGERGRKRFKCVELGSKRVYLFSPLAEVVPVNQTSPSNTDKK